MFWIVFDNEYLGTYVTNDDNGCWIGLMWDAIMLLGNVHRKAKIANMVISHALYLIWYSNTMFPNDYIADGTFDCFITAHYILPRSNLSVLLL